MIQIRSTHSVDNDEEESTTTSTTLINQSKYCLYLLNNETTNSREIDFLDDVQLLVCHGDSDQTGDIEKQLHKSLVRVIGETNLIKSHVKSEQMKLSILSYF